MPSDPLTKVDPVSGNHALKDLLSKASLVLVDERGHLDERALNASLKSRSRGASKKMLGAEGLRAPGPDGPVWISTARDEGVSASLFYEGGGAVLGNCAEFCSFDRLGSPTTTTVVGTTLAVAATAPTTT
eukprot:7963417-Pyramimonas_sp.AAC.1